MSMDDEITVRCPYCDDDTEMVAHVDTIGDPSVGMQPDGLFQIDGPCVHVDAINEDIEEFGEENIGKKWPTFMRLIHHHYNEMARQEAGFEQMMTEKYGEDQWS